MIRHGTIGGLALAALLVALGTASPAAGIDLSGDYVGFNVVSFTVRVMQVGSDLTVSGHVIFNSTPYPVSASGTVDLGTGAVSVSGEIETLCADFGFSGTGDGEELTGTAIAHCVNGTQGPGPFLLSKCGNGMIDPLETCERTAGGAADCCSARCREDPAGTACPSDGNECTTDVCNATGACTHVPLPPAVCRRCNGTCRRDIAQCMATQCAGLASGDCRRNCKLARIRTLAYALSECRVDASGLVVARQALRIRQGDQEPITAVEFGPLRAVPDPDGVCVGYGNSRWGSQSVRTFPLQRLGVSPDGSGVVFEVNDEFSLHPMTHVPDNQKGFFFVRADGSEPPRRLGPPSREPSFGGSFAFSPRYRSARPVGGSPLRTGGRGPAARMRPRSSCLISRPTSRPPK